MPLSDLPRIPRRKYLTGADRRDFAQRVAAVYTTEQVSIQQISDQTGRSYGAIHQLLTTAGVRIRRPGPIPERQPAIPNR